MGYIDKKTKIAVIGPTSSGKSDFAVNLAKKLSASIFSVDSRQIYKELNLSSGKVLPLKKDHHGHFFYKDIKHYGINIASAKRHYSIAQFASLHNKLTSKSTEKMIYCGGTAFWMDAIINNWQFPNTPNSKQHRQLLNKLTISELQNTIKKLDINNLYSNIDWQNPARLIRAVEVLSYDNASLPKQNTNQNSIWIGLKPEKDILEKNIITRIKQRINEGMIEEIQQLHTKHHMTYAHIISYGLELKYISLYLQNILSRQEMIDQLFIAHRQFTKRQMTWWKRNTKILWLDPNQKDSFEKSLSLISKFELKK